MKRHLMRLLVLPVVMGVALGAGGATAQAKKLKTKDLEDGRYVPDKIKKSKKRDIGWAGSLDVGATMSFSQNSNVVGSTDGYAWSLGAQIDGALDYIMGPHEWRTTLKLGEAFTRTSQLDEFVKTSDKLDLRSTYLYLVESYPWFGPYAELRFNTSIFDGYDVRAEATDYELKQLDGTTSSFTGRRTRLSDPFAPLTLRETIGAFARPIDSEAIKVEFKLGFSARQTFADDQRAVDDDSKTKNIIELKELENFYQGGPAAGIGVQGKLSGKRVSYFGLVEAMMPVINSKNDSDDRSVADLTNISFEAGLSVKLVTWATLIYQFKALREPQLVDKWQMQNNLLLSFSYTLFDTESGTKKQ